MPQAENFEDLTAEEREDFSSTKVIKVIHPHICPHCSEEIITCFSSVTPTITWTLKRKDIDNAKKKVIEALDEMKFTDKRQKAEILVWLNSDDTQFGPDEVPYIIDQLRSDKIDL
jgi:hypothetical protein